ncbi:MAG: rod shape-determining protein MreC [Gammaproteobacteria bacterium]
MSLNTACALVRPTLLFSFHDVALRSKTIKASRSLFVHGRSSVLRLAAVAALSSAMMVADHEGQHLERVRGALSTLMAPIHYAVSLPISFGDWLAEVTTSKTQLMAQNDELREQNLLVRAQLDKAAEVQAENARLRKLLDSSAKTGDRVLVAELLAVDMDPYSRRIVLNKGTRDGVMPGQSLVDSQGIMGQVVHAGPFSSNALLITDPNHAVPVQVNRNGVRAVAVGTGNADELKLTHVPNNADLQNGDILVSSGLGGRFPEGYPVGRVLRVERHNGRPFADVAVKPSAKLERNREVLLVWPARPDRAVDTAFAPDIGPDLRQDLLKALGGAGDESIEVVQ